VGRSPKASGFGGRTYTPHSSEKKPCVLAELLVTKLLMDVWISTLNLPGSLREAFHQKPEDSFDRWAQRPNYAEIPVVVQPSHIGRAGLTCDALLQEQDSVAMG
jgi:hypothetical protein